MVFKAKVIFFKYLKWSPIVTVYDLDVINLQVVEKSMNVYKIRVGLSEPQ